jgi:hypothetical protein
VLKAAHWQQQNFYKHSTGVTPSATQLRCSVLNFQPVFQPVIKGVIRLPMTRSFDSKQQQAKQHVTERGQTSNRGSRAAL